MADALSLLDITTDIGRFHVRIDGVPHFISHPDALTLSQINQLQHLRPRAIEMQTRAEELTSDDERELGAILDRMVRIVLDAPEAVHQKLIDAHRLAIVDAFSKLRSSGRKTGATVMAMSRTGAKSSRGSKGSTVARRKAG